MIKIKHEIKMFEGMRFHFIGEINKKDIKECMEILWNFNLKFAPFMTLNIDSVNKSRY